MTTDTVARNLLERLLRALDDRPPPPVRGLHLPPAPWDGTKDGEFGAIQLADGSLGLSYVLLDDTLAALGDAQHRSSIAGADPREIARWWIGPPGARRTLGFAAVNALTRHLFDRVGYVPPTATDSIGGLDPQAGEHVGMIGYFPPLVKQVTARGARLTVLELRRDLAGERAGFRITLDPRELERCDKVLSTSTVLLNDTLDEVLAHCGRARVFVMVGPGAGCLPDTLFQRGVTLLGGTWIEDAEGFVQALAAGEPWGNHTRKFAIASDGYPGIDALLRRAA